MTGIELAWKVRLVRSGLPVVLTTGFGDLLSGEALRDAGVRGLLRKPFSLEDVATCMKQALTRPAAAAAR